MSHREVEGVVTAFCIKLVPKDSGERVGAIHVGIMHITDIEHHHLNVRLILVPVLEVAQIRKRHTCNFKRRNIFIAEQHLLGGVNQAVKSLFAILARQAIAGIFQEVGLS